MSNQQLPAKEYLGEIVKIDKRIDRLLDLRQEYMAKAARVTSCPSLTPKTKGNHSNPMENVIAKMIDLEKEVDREVDELVDRKRAAKRVIDALSDSRYRDILEMRYFHGRKWERIMEDMGYESSQTYRLHGLVLREFQRKADEIGLLVS
jgi:DNA-directed RNA polymerase specialized sigma subunit